MANYDLVLATLQPVTSFYTSSNDFFPLLLITVVPRKVAQYWCMVIPQRLLHIEKPLRTNHWSNLLVNICNGKGIQLGGSRAQKFYIFFIRTSTIKM